MNLQAHPTNGGSTSAEATTADPLDVALLTRRMAAGDEAAYRTFYDAFFNRLSRYLLVVAAGDEEAAREALQSALVRVVRHIKVFPNDVVFWSWLTVLARSALSDQTRKRRRYLAFLDRFSLHTQVEHTLPENPPADATLLTLLESSLRSLPLDERRILEAKYLSGRSVREIAGELDLSEKAVESRLVRIRQKLKTAILAALKRE